MTSLKVDSLFRWPVCGFDGEQLEAAEFGSRGMSGDRVVGIDGERDGAIRMLSSNVTPAMRFWRAATSPSGIVVHAPDGQTRPWNDPELIAPLSESLGRPVTMRFDERANHLDHRTVHVIFGSSLAALETELGMTFDCRRFRPNIVLSGDHEPFSEGGLVGSKLSFSSGLTLRVTEGCERCAIPTYDPARDARAPELLRHIVTQHGKDFGVNCIVENEGPIAIGDSAEPGPLGVS